MKIKFSYVVTVAVILAAAYMGTLFTGSYGGRIWVDAILHLLGGMFLGIFWLWVVGRRFPWSPKSLVVISIPVVALSGSLVWEALEGLLRIFLPHVASVLGFNSPIDDTISDLVFGVIGGLTVAAVYLGVSKKKDTVSTDSM